VLVLVCCCFCYSNSLADTTTSPTTQNLSQGTITAPYGGCPSGTTAAQVNSSNWSKQTVRWGECVNTFELTVAINQALSASGISVDKAHYKWKYVHCFNTSNQGSGTASNFCNNNLNNRVNQNTGEVLDGAYKNQWDQLVVDIEITDANGTVIKSETWSMDKWYLWNGANSHSANEVTQGSVRWQVVEGNIEFYNHVDKIGTIYTPNQLGDVRFRFVGADKGAWDGYYGPVVSDLQTWFTYRTNPCTDTALYDPSCPGYATALAQYEYDTNCAANALYDAGCPGYAQAFYNAQCAANPLYDSGCAGYATAYYNQQCSLDALYDTGCDGYAAAYLTQQCNLDPLHDSSCDGYEAAYLKQQCDLDATYSVQCTGYEQAYFDKQCLLNPQYDDMCPGYVAPVTPSDPTDIDDGTGTGDSIVDDILETPDLPIVVIPTAPEPEIALPEIEIDTGVGTNNTNTTPEVEIPDIEIELPDISIESIEQEVENEIEQELEMEPEVSEPETDTNNETTTEDSTTEETTEENTVEEETTEEETTEEETTEEESTEEESTEEESTEEESTEEESTDEKEEESEEKESEEKEESDSEEVVVKKETKNKKVKKLSAKEKAAAKKKKMKEIIKKKLEKLAILMGEAQSLKDQAALQQLIASLINYVPGFNEYGKYNIPGINFYQPEAIYQDKKIPENQRGLRNGLASELLHKKMVDMQYEGME